LRGKDGVVYLKIESGVDKVDDIFHDFDMRRGRSGAANKDRDPEIIRYVLQHPIGFQEHEHEHEQQQQQQQQQQQMGKKEFYQEGMFFRFQGFQ